MITTFIASQRHYASHTTSQGRPRPADTLSVEVSVRGDNPLWVRMGMANVVASVPGQGTELTDDIAVLPGHPRVLRFAPQQTHIAWRMQDSDGEVVFTWMF